MTIYCRLSIYFQFWKVLNMGLNRTSCNNLVVGPSSADSANSLHGFFSLVQKANGIAEILLLKSQTV